MKKTLALTLLSLLVLAPCAFGAANFGADVEINTTFDSLSNGTTVSTMDMGGRVNFTASGSIENKDTGFFAKGNGNVLANLNGSASIDDAWGQIGTKSFSLKMGRFEGEGLYAKGEDIYIASAGGPGRYEANYARGRDNGGLALAFNPSDTMMVEIDAIYGNNGAKAWTAANGATGTATQNKFGIRPLIKLSLSNLTIKAGADLLSLKSADKDVKGTTTKFGFGGVIEAKLGNITVGGAAASGKVEDKDYFGMTGKTKQTTSNFSGYVTLPMGDNKVGLGAGYTKEDVNKTSEIYAFGSYQYKLPVEGAWLKFAVSYAASDMKNVGKDKTDIGARVRLNYTF